MDRNNVRQILSQGEESPMTAKNPGKTSCVALPIVIYDRIRNRRNHFEIVPILPIEMRNIKSGKIQNNFLLLMKFKKVTISKYFFLFLLYITLVGTT